MEKGERRLSPFSILLRSPLHFLLSHSHSPASPRDLKRWGARPRCMAPLRPVWTLRIVTILPSSQPPLLHARAVPAGTVPGAAPNDADANKISGIFAQGAMHLLLQVLHLTAVTSPYLPGTGPPHFPGVCDCRDCRRQRRRRCGFCGLFGL